MKIEKPSKEDMKALKLAMKDYKNGKVVAFS